MIGQHCVATLWSVQYSFEAPRTENTQRFVTGETLILTADPTGDDLRQVTERFVMGAKPAPGYSKFLLTNVRRVADVTGLAQLVAHDRAAWTDSAGAGLALDAIRDLALARAEIAALKAQLEAFDLVPVGLQGSVR